MLLLPNIAITIGKRLFQNAGNENASHQPSPQIRPRADGGPSGCHEKHLLSVKPFLTFGVRALEALRISILVNLAHTGSKPRGITPKDSSIIRQTTFSGTGCSISVAFV